jgi:glycerate 2-kinase
VNPLADLARSMFAAAVAAVQPEPLIRRIEFLPQGVAFEGAHCCPPGRLVLVACGKAAASMTSAFLRRSVRHPDEVLVIVPTGVAVAERLTPWTRRASHPGASEAGVEAARDLLALVSSLAVDDGVVLLLSGGASALLAAPLPAVAVGEAHALTAALLRTGVPIRQLNAVRKHLFAALGGRLAAATAAQVLTLALSDVAGDDLATIASGPTVGDPTTCADALEILGRYHLRGAFPDISRVLAARDRQAELESPKPGDARLARAHTALLGSSREALLAAAATASAAGFGVLTLTRSLRGDARTLGYSLAELAACLANSAPLACLAAGESTVQVRGDGCGGRNLELALAAAVGLAEVPERCILAATTDGVDGVSPAAGAVVDGGTLVRAVRSGRDAERALHRNDAWGFFSGLPEAIVTGPTGTNVADLVFILAAGPAPLFASEARQPVLTLPSLGGPLMPRPR